MPNPSHQPRRNHPASWPVSHSAEPDGAGSALRGLMTFYLCEASEIHGPLQAVLVGTSGHMGSRTIFILENSLNQWLSARFEKKVIDE